MIESDKLSSRTRHIDIKYLCEQGIIDVKYCAADTVITDMMTKPLPKDRLGNLADTIEMNFE
jgi:hypothetical protein